ncbi:hypothetical protein CLH62_14595 [Marinobacter guineae]|uniref:Antirepressor protein C-terminal domain-containing protein n=1 Tax=Marinobacter guineae TaxID=432303 RepID=A0A2G1VBX2_9GAMM|nr:phage antirepressor KilAC domain-containing protein [Marinobacter guineae]PHQ24160.1 hypothetical protein CLH62_14595 [Marinobacter guineae]
MSKQASFRRDRFSKSESAPGQFQLGMTPSEFAKRLNGVNCQRINQELARRDWLYRDAPGSWRVHSWAMGRYLTERHHNIERSTGLVVVRCTPVLLEKGAAVIYRLYLANGLPMKQSWNGEFTQNEALQGAA